MKKCTTMQRLLSLILVVLLVSALCIPVSAYNSKSYTKSAGSGSISTSMCSISLTPSNQYAYCYLSYGGVTRTTDWYDTPYFSWSSTSYRSVAYSISSGTGYIYVEY